MAPLRCRPYAGVADLRRMQQALSHAFGRGAEHVGDVAWGAREHSHLALTRMVTLVEGPAADLLGWTWVSANGWVEAVSLLDGDAAVAEALVAALLGTVRASLDAGDEVERISVLCDEGDTALAAALGAQGFAPLDEHLEITRRRLDDLPLPFLPPGLCFSGLEDDAMVEAKVEAHRAAFAPSRRCASTRSTPCAAPGRTPHRSPASPVRPAAPPTSPLASPPTGASPSSAGRPELRRPARGRAPPAGP